MTSLQFNGKKPSPFSPEPMEFVEIISPLDSAYYAIKQLSTAGIIELLDLTKHSEIPDKRYTEMYLICEESEKSLRYFEEQLTKFKMMPEKPDAMYYINNQPQYNINELSGIIKDTEKQLHEKISIQEQLKKQKITITQKLELLNFYKPLMENEQRSFKERDQSQSAYTMELLSFDQNLLQNVTGFVQPEKLHKLESIIYRISRRNAIFNIGQINKKGLIPYCIFTSSETLNLKIKKICESYYNSVYDFPGDSDSIISMEYELNEDLRNIVSIEKTTKNVNRQFLENIKQYFWTWRMIIHQEKQIWEAVDYGNFTEIEESVIYRGWCPARYTEAIPNLLNQASIASGSPIAIRFQTRLPEEVPNITHVPTFIETNDFTYSFQLLNDAYGVPSYGEINGGAFYCMYPFLFGMMFGDIGHAIFYLLITAVLFYIDHKQKKSHQPLSEMGGMIKKFKWLLLFLSVCAFYCGLLYNECFGVPIDFFGTKYPTYITEGTTEVYQRDPPNATYPFGIDPVWVFKTNELIFLNSFKMKLSIIVGMLQMIFGLILGFINYIRQKKYAELLVTWLPNFLYFVPFFGYLVCLIIMKWCMQFPDGDSSPNLIQVLIGMILPNDDPKLVFYKGQQSIQKIITVLFIASIPLCLLAKPIYQIIRFRKDKTFSVLEAFVMNLIHVIEFCLSALSHSASYLRLWALSLAHSQLSHVLWEQLFLMGANMNPSISWLFIFICFMAFAVMTVAILLGMEAFSALLHAIRLMWVEFSSKFYDGTGVEFKPLSLKTALNEISII